MPNDGQDAVLRVSENAVKVDLELLCEACGEHLCDAEHGDTLRVLLAVSASHRNECPLRRR